MSGRGTDVLVDTDTTAPATAAPDPSVRELGRIFLLLCGLTVVVRLPAFFVSVFNSDETFLATQARVIQAGGELYRDVADRKPPLVPYLYAATFELFGSTALWTVRVVAMLAVAVTGLLLAIEAWRRYGRGAAWIAGVLFVVAMVAFAPQDGQAANFEVFMLPWMTAAILLARRGHGLTSGIAVAVATLAKQTGAATLLPVLYLMARARGRDGMMRAALGFTIPTGLVALAIGPGQLADWVVLGNGSYLGDSQVKGYIVGLFAVMTLAWILCNLPIVWRLPAAWLDRHRVANDDADDIDLWLWLASAAISVAVGFRFFGHYYMQLTAPAALITAGVLARGARRLATGTVAVAVVAGLGFSAVGYAVTPFGGEPSYEAVSRYLEHHAGPRDRIQVWGSVPEIYWASDRLPATRFATVPTFLTGHHPGRPEDASAGIDEDARRRWKLFLQDFANHPPKYLLDTSPANLRGARYYPIADFPQFATIVDAEYEYVRSIDGIAIYVRR